MEPSEIKSRQDAIAYKSSLKGQRYNRAQHAYGQAIELSRYGITNPNTPPVIELEDLGIKSTHPEDSGCISWSAVETDPKLLTEREQLFAQVFQKLLNPPRIP